jgi:DedD protein
MDRRVKERLVGATLLGALIVTLVPELLSGPKPAAAPTLNPAEAVRNVTVDLSTRQPVAALKPPTEQAGPASAVSAAPIAAAVNGEGPPSALETPGSSPTSPAPTSTAIGEPHRSWAVQVGSFASRDNADKLVHQLKARGFSVYVVSSGSGSSARHKVRIGPIADRGTAERAVSNLKAQRYAASIVPPAT